MATIKPKDLRSPLAKARDAWLASDEGQRALSPDILLRNAHIPYLTNRLVSAFLAGAAAGERLAPRPVKSAIKVTKAKK